MSFGLNIKENAIDSFNEALDKFSLGESGDLRQYKFAILNMAHFVELTLKQYLVGIDRNLVFMSRGTEERGQVSHCNIRVFGCFARAHK